MTIRANLSICRSVDIRDATYVKAAAFNIVLEDCVFNSLQEHSTK